MSDVTGAGQSGEMRKMPHSEIHPVSNQEGSDLKSRVLPLDEKHHTGRFCARDI